MQSEARTYPKNATGQWSCLENLNRQNSEWALNEQQTLKSALLCCVNCAVTALIIDCGVN